MTSDHALKLPHGWVAEKRDGVWRLEQWLDGEWLRAGVVDSPIVARLIDDIAADALAANSRQARGDALCKACGKRSAHMGEQCYACVHASEADRG